MSRITFINQNREANIVEEARKELKLVSENMSFYEKFNDVEDEQDFIHMLCRECADVEEIKWAIDQYEDLPPFNEYGLSFDYVELGTFDDQEEDYFRYQITYGGPSVEIRFYEDYFIEFVYLNWFCGVGFDVTDEDWAIFVHDYFADIEMLDFETKREETNYYEKKMEQEEEEDKDE